MSSNELLPLDIFNKAMEMIRSRRCEARRDVEKLLGWDENHSMPMGLMAQKLGIIQSQLHYMLHCESIEKKAKEKRIADKAAVKMPFKNYKSSELSFSISLPSGWYVSTDMLHAEPENDSVEESYAQIKTVSSSFKMSLDVFTKMVGGEEEHQEISAKAAYQRLLEEAKTKALSFEKFKKAYEYDPQSGYQIFFKELGGVLQDGEIESLTSKMVSAQEAYDSLVENPETFLIGFKEFQMLHEEDMLQQKQERGKKAKLADMEIGFFSAYLPDSEDYICVEVTKLMTPVNMTALKLYVLDKLPIDAVPTGRRPHQGIDVDGMHGEKYYFIFYDGETKMIGNMAKFFNVYFVEKGQGWILSCSCKESAFDKLKSVFERIIKSFKRI